MGTVERKDGNSNPTHAKLKVSETVQNTDSEDLRVVEKVCPVWQTNCVAMWKVSFECKWQVRLALD